MSLTDVDPKARVADSGSQSGERARRAALEEAVRAGQARGAEIRAVVDDALADMSAAVDDIRVGDLEGQDEARQVAERFKFVFEKARGDLDSLFSRQEERLASFNVVFFGRTRAGKSSTITALVRGDGRGISPGQTDFTDRVLDERWGDDLLRVKDTPGTQGRRAAELADIARREVEVADVVILAFDDENQLRGEFAEISAHVKALGKPAIAVLNIKERAWGDPDRCLDRPHMRGVAKDVRDHAAHVREQLAVLGLDGVPVVAVNAQRAVYARAADVYAGPDAPQCQALRELWGRPLLLERSNFAVLDILLEELASHDPAAMRTAMLGQQATLVLGETAEACDALCGRAEEVAQTLETSVRQLLELTGHPQHFPPTEDGGGKRVTAILEQLESLRDGGFGVGAVGDGEINAKRYVAEHLGAAEQATRARAAAVVAKAMQQGRKLTDVEFRTKVVKQTEVQRALDNAARRLGNYLQSRVETIVLQLSGAMSELQIAGTAVKGDTGRAADRLATGLSLSELALPLAAIAATQFWNPGFYLAAVIVAVAAAAAWVTGKLAKLFKRRSRRQRDEEITRAVAEAERAVRQAFADLRTYAVGHLVTGCRAQLLAKIEALAAAARTLRLIMQAAEASADSLRDAQARVLLGPNKAQDGVRAAQAGTAARLGREGSDLWLNERWVGETDLVARRAVEQACLPRPSVPRSFGRRISSDEVDEWIQRSLAGAAVDGKTRRALHRLRSRGDSALPSITVVGDYSTGKSSFLRRLHWELGVAAPRTLRVGAAPETDRVRHYPLNRLDLVDTPGHQSGRVSEDGRAREAILGSAAVLHLVGPSLLTGSTAEVDLLLGSLEHEARLRLVERTFWLINRIDELPADPFDDPSGFVAACEARRNELKQQLEARPALSSIDARVDARRILCIASNPYSALGGRRLPTQEQLDMYASWDGMAGVLALLERLRPRLERHAVPAGRAERAIQLVWAGGARTTEEAKHHDARRAKLASLAQALEAEATAGDALREKLRAEAGDSARARVVDLIGALRSSKEPEDDEKRLKRWWKDEILLERMTAWHASAAQELDQWRTAASTRVDALANSAEFRAAFDEHESQARQFRADPRAVKKAGGKAEKTVRAGASTIGKIDRKAVLDIGHKLNHKFRPWEAKKLADRFANASKIAGRVALFIAVANAVYGLVTLGKQKQRDRKAEQEFQEALADVLSDVEAWVDDAITGTTSDPGILHALAADIADLRRAGRARRDEAASESAKCKALNSRASAQRVVLDEGLLMLKRTPGTVASWV